MVDLIKMNLKDMNNTKIKFICTVGTSMLENNGIDVNNFFLKGDVNKKYERWFEENKNSINLINNQKNVGNCAEIGTLELFCKKNKIECFSVLLLCTMTGESFFCGYKIKEYYKYIKVEVKEIENLKGAKDKSFAEKGLPSFLNILFNEVSKAQNQGYEVILNPTGGYKSLFPLMSIVGILKNCKVIYKYEDSENLVEIPPLPLGVDIQKWNMEMIRLETVVNRQYSDVREIYDKLSPEAKTLISIDNGEIKSTEIYNFFKERIGELDKRFNTLYVKTKNTRLSDFFKDNQLWERFVKLTEIGHLIWKGDRVPEMVEHGLRHHTDLFIIAEKILLPILYKDDQFLTEEELFILISAIYLHDCGHVIGRIKQNDDIITLYPNEIREFHHILGYERLKNYNDNFYNNKAIYDNIKINKESDEDLWKDYLCAIATVGLYHRKAMPLLEKDSVYNKCPFFEKEYCPLIKREQYVNFNKNEEKPRLHLITAIFRIIDGLDNQVRRTGDEQEIQFHFAQLDNEIEEERQRAEQIKAIIKNYFAQIDQLIENAKNAYRKKEASTGETTSDNFNQKDFRNEINGILNGIQDQEKFLINEYIKARLKEDFIKFQKEHYDKHKAVEEIIIKYEYNGTKGIHNFEFNFKFSNKTNEDFKKEIINSLESEYSGSVKKILNDKNICLKFQDSGG